MSNKKREEFKRELEALLKKHKAEVYLEFDSAYSEDVWIEFSSDDENWILEGHAIEQGD